MTIQLGPFTMTGASVPHDAELAGQFLADAARSLGWDPAALPDPAGRPPPASSPGWPGG